MLWSLKLTVSVLFLAIVTTGCSSERQVDTSGTQSSDTHYSNEQIADLVYGETSISTEKLVEMVGEPDFKGIGDQGDTFWQYYDLTLSEDDGRIYNTNFKIVDGNVVYTWVTNTRDAYQDAEE
ncbi:MAG TPA: hypothetical protein EYG03_18975 [Planctomycetes bacterium]|nr:hypothetical protein [Fuerstiella sp.]HIK94034.1 hypothetical protein [Planctomycetota bacterium]